jgi:hypothetical protein
LFVAWWALTHRIDRFWVPMIPVVALLAAAGATWSNSVVWKLAVAGGIVVTVVYNLAFVTSGLSGDNSYLADLDAARRNTANLTTPGIAALNRRHLPPDAKVLTVGEAAVFDATFPVVYNTVFDTPIIMTLCTDYDPDVPDAEQSVLPLGEIRERFHKAGITHVFVNWSEIVRYRTTYGYSDFVTPDLFERLQEQGLLDEDPSMRGMGEVESAQKSWQRELGTWGARLKSDEGNWVTSQFFRVNLDGK